MPSYPLPTDLYERFDLLMIEHGGKWRKNKGYVFPTDPRLAFEGLVSRPDTLATQLVKLLDVRSGDYVLQPNARRDLVDELLKGPAHLIVAVSDLPLDPLPETCERLTLHVCPFQRVKLHPGDFDRCVMIPPLEKGRDVTYAERALHLLRPGGTLVAIIAPNDRRTGLRKLIEAGDSQIHAGFPDGNLVLRVTKT